MILTWSFFFSHENIRPFYSKPHQQWLAPIIFFPDNLDTNINIRYLRGDRFWSKILYEIKGLIRLRTITKFRTKVKISHYLILLHHFQIREGLQKPNVFVIKRVPIKLLRTSSSILCYLKSAGGLGTPNAKKLRVSKLRSKKLAWKLK